LRATRFRQTLWHTAGQWPERHLRCVVLILCTLVTAEAPAQLIDSLDAYPPRWHLVGSDCDAVITRHESEPVGGIGGSGCESVSLQCGHGTQALLEYRMEPVLAMDELVASVFVKSAKAGQSIGLRVRFPLVSDPATGQAVSVLLLGESYRDTGRWQKLVIRDIEKPLRLKTLALRREYGAAADFGQAFADAVVINAYTGPGNATLLIDSLSVDGLVPISSIKTLGQRAGAAAVAHAGGEGFDTGALSASLASGVAAGEPAAPFAPGRITRILQHNGEPLEWLKTLGFDAVLLPRAADQAILSEAMRARMQVFAPPPTAADPQLTSLLQPLAGYYLGTSQDASQVAAVSAQRDRIGRLPLAWQRPVIVAPAESLRLYAGIADALVHDLPPPVRGLSGSEEIALLADRNARVGRPLLEAVGVQSEAPAGLTRQLDAISAAIGAPRGDDLFWHAMWLQVARSLEASPRAILFRSTRSLTSGKPEDQRRSMALSYVNRFVEAVGMLAASGVAASPLSTAGPDYHCGRIEFPGGQLLVASTRAQHRGLVLAGDGDTLQISLPPADANKIAWRLTHFTAERLTIQSSPQGSRLEIISPDVVETIVLSSDPLMGSRLIQAVRRVANQAAIDRWQLTRESVQQVREDWQGATASRIAATSRSALDMLGAAEGTLRDAEPMYRAGDWGSTLRLSRRADAWMLKARWQLHTALSPGQQLSTPTSSPPLLSPGGIAAQILWWPLMSDSGWGENLLIGGSLDSAALLGEAGWSVGRRGGSITQSEVRIAHGPQLQGDGCLVASVVATTPDPLPGGYAGTAVQIRSPSIRAAAKTALRIDAKIRTLGFGGPDQGVLVYDNRSGPELGVLVRATPQWQNVRLYRQALDDSPLHVLFELIGAGEVMIDDVQIRPWHPTDPVEIPLRRMAELPH
jgi:hypothetical protein